jgi:Zn-finger protein
MLQIIWQALLSVWFLVYGYVAKCFCFFVTLSAFAELWEHQQGKDGREIVSCTICHFWQ